MEITYLEDDDDTPRAQRPRVSQAATRAQSYRPPVPRGSEHSAWFICTNDNCSKAGHVATGKHTPTHVVKRAKSCKGCRGLGLTPEGEVCDEGCNGSGRRIIDEKDVVLPVHCPICRQPMDFLQEGGFPSGYPRMSTPHSDRVESGLPDDGNSQIGVSFGRSRQIS